MMTLGVKLPLLHADTRKDDYGGQPPGGACAGPPGVDIWPVDIRRSSQ
jgi:hypothetical protein